MNTETNTGTAGTTTEQQADTNNQSASLPPGTTEGRITHFVNLEGDRAIHRAAIITEVPGEASELPADTVHLTVFLPAGFQFVTAKHDDGAAVHSWHFPERA